MKNLSLLSKQGADSISGLLIKLINNYYYLLISAFIISFAIICFLKAYYSMASFDGAMNLQVPVNIIEQGRYATSYNGFTDFDHKIQSGIPLLLPISLSFIVFGKTFFAAQIISAIYLIMTGIIIVLFLQFYSNRLSAFAALIFFCLTPYLMRYGHHIYGEIPALFYLLLSLFILLLYQKQYRKNNILPFIIGFSYGLAYLTKTVMLIALPSIGLYVLIDLYLLKHNNIKNYLFMLLGFLVPILAFEIYRCYCLGLDVFFVWWQKNIYSILSQAGVKKKFNDTDGILFKILIHSKMIKNQFNIGDLHFIAFFLFPYLCIGIKKTNNFIQKKYQSISSSIVILTGTTFTYFSWWIVLTPTSKAWARRIINGFILQEILFLVSLFYFYNFIKHLQKKTITKINKLILIASYLTFIFLVVAVFDMSLNYYKAFDIAIKPTQSKKDAQKISERIKNLPLDSKVCGVGWWQAPRLSFLSERVFYDLKKLKIPDYGMDTNKEIFLAIDPEGYFIAKQAYEFIFKKTIHELVAKEGRNYLYKIISLKRIGFEKEEKLKKNVESFIDFAKQDYTVLKGLYAFEKTFRWSGKKSAYLLTNKNNNCFYLKLYFPAEESSENESVKLEVTMNNVLVKTFKIDKRGEFEKSLNVSKYILNRKQHEVILSVDRLYKKRKPTKDIRKLAFIVNKLGFVLECPKTRF